MLNIPELEEKWIQYKIKSYIPHLIIFLSLSVIFVIAYYIYVSSKIDSTHVEKSTPIHKQKVAQKKVVPDIPPVVKIQEKIIEKKELAKTIIKQEKQQVIMQPSFDFMQKMKQDVIVDTPRVEVVKQRIVTKNPKPTPPKKKTTPIVAKKVIVAEEIKVEDTIVEENKNILEVPEPEPEIIKPKLITINRQNTHDDIQHVIKRFKKSNNPALSLFAAKKYYELEEYNQAYNYALITNELNNDIEESWIIFAKSLTKLGEKDKAIAILEKYINNSHSQRANILLNNIKSGKMK